MSGEVFGYGNASVLYEKKGSKAGPTVPPSSSGAAARPKPTPPAATAAADSAAEALALKKLTAKEKSLFGEDTDEGAGAGVAGKGRRSKLDSLFGDDGEEEPAPRKGGGLFQSEFPSTTSTTPNKVSMREFTRAYVCLCARICVDAKYAPLSLVLNK